MHDLSHCRKQLEERVAKIAALEAKKSSGVRPWKQGVEHIRLGVLGEGILAVETNRKLPPVGDVLPDGGWDFKIRGRLVDSKARPYPWRDLLHPVGDPLQADWYVVVCCDTTALTGEVVGMASKAQVAAAPLAPEHIATQKKCVIVLEADLVPLPEYFYTVHALDE